jgi:hypothetical protein
MDGLEDEPPFFTEEEIENIFQEEPTEEEIQENFSTIEPETGNIFQDNEEVLEEQISEPIVVPEEVETFKINVQVINETLNEVNEVIDSEELVEDDLKKKR